MTARLMVLLVGAAVCGAWAGRDDWRAGSDWHNQRQYAPGGWQGQQYNHGGTIYNDWQGPGGRTVHCQSYRWRGNDWRVVCR